MPFSVIERSGFELTNQEDIMAKTAPAAAARLVVTSTREVSSGSAESTSSAMARARSG